MPDNTKLLLLNNHQVDALIDPDEVLSAVREAFVLHSQGSGRLFPVVRERLSSGGVFGIKSGDVGGESLLGFKAAGFWPENRQRNAEAHQATIMLIDPDTGRPLSVIDGNAITTIRTGAAGGLGLRQFARPDSTRLCIFGTGTQAQIQARFALRLFPSLRILRFLSHDGRPAPRFEAAVGLLAARLGCKVVQASHPDAAVAASDIVITATTGQGPLFHAEAVQPGTHLNCVGTDTIGKRELPEGLPARAHVFVDDLVQAREIGEMQWSRQTHGIQIGDVLTGKADFARKPDDITLFDMTGMALQDLTVARLLMQKARAAGIGTLVDWPWQS